MSAAPLVIGVGNEWRGDDGAGLAVARRLRDAGVRAVARGGEPVGLLDAWEGEPRVILVDAVDSGARPGSVHRVDATAGALPPELFRTSTHHLSVADAVELARALDRLPQQLEVYGIEGRDFSAGGRLGPEVEAAVAHVVAELRERLR